MKARFDIFHQYNLSNKSVHDIFGSANITKQASLLNILIRSLKDYSYHDDDYKTLADNLDEETKAVFLRLGGSDD